MLGAECHVGDKNLGLVVAYVCVYLLGVPPPKACMFHLSNITPKWRRISMVETKRAAQEFKTYFENNPDARYYIFTDDTGNKSCVFVAYPCVDEYAPERKTIKRLLLSVSAPIGGSAEDHAKLNRDHLVEAGFPLDRFNGGCTDHKAECEIRETFKLVMREAGINDRDVHVWFGDAFHKVSLVCEYASTGLCKDKAMKEATHKQLAYALRSLWLQGDTLTHSLAKSPILESVDASHPSLSLLMRDQQTPGWVT